MAEQPNQARRVFGLPLKELSWYCSAVLSVSKVEVYLYGIFFYQVSKLFFSIP
jgi:hypothetical protein